MAHKIPPKKPMSGHGNVALSHVSPVKPPTFQSRNLEPVKQTHFPSSPQRPLLLLNKYYKLLDLKSFNIPTRFIWTIDRTIMTIIITGTSTNSSFITSCVFTSSYFTQCIITKSCAIRPIKISFTHTLTFFYLLFYYFLFFYLFFLLTKIITTGITSMTFETICIVTIVSTLVAMVIIIALAKP